MAKKTQTKTRSLARLRNTREKLRRRRYRDERETLADDAAVDWFFSEPLPELIDWNGRLVDPDWAWRLHLDPQTYTARGPIDLISGLTPVERWLNAIGQKNIDTRAADSDRTEAAALIAEDEAVCAEEPAISSDARADTNSFNSWLHDLEHDPMAILKKLELDDAAMEAVRALKAFIWPADSAFFVASVHAPPEGWAGSAMAEELRHLLPGVVPDFPVNVPGTNSRAAWGLCLAMVALGYPRWKATVRRSKTPQGAVADVLAHFFAKFGCPDCYANIIDRYELDQDDLVTDVFREWGSSPLDEDRSGGRYPVEAKPARSWPESTGLPLLGWYVARSQGLSTRLILADRGYPIPGRLLHAMEAVEPRRYGHRFGCFEHLAIAAVELKAGEAVWRRLNKDNTFVTHLDSVRLRWLTADNSHERAEIIAGLTRSDVSGLADFAGFFVRYPESVRNEVDGWHSIYFANWYRYEAAEHARRGRAFLIANRAIESVERASSAFHRRQKERERANFLTRYNKPWPAHELAAVIDEKWTFTEVTDAKLLFDAGVAHRNCVASYASRCISGESAIVQVHAGSQLPHSATLRELTIEVHPPTGTIVQIRGKFNSAASPLATTIVRKWAALKSLNFAPHAL